MGKYWKVPVLMVLSLTSGAGIALAQHFFYSHLNGRETDGSQTSLSQELNIGLGTGMAYLAKTFLLVGVSLAYTQLFWRKIQHQGLPIRDIDSLFGSMTNACVLIQFRLWIKYLGLMIVTALAWLIPLAAVIAPTALTTQYSPTMRNKYQMMQIPTPNFTRNVFAVLEQVNSWVEFYNWYSPHPSFNEVALAVATSGSFLTAPIPSANSSYILEFYGPSLQCSNPPSSFQTEFQSTLEKLAVNEVYYLAWRANNTGGNLDWLEYVVNYKLGEFDVGDLGPNNEPATFYVAVTNNITNAYVSATMQLIECSLFNSSYIFNVTNENGIQNYGVIQSQALNAVDTLDEIDSTWPYENRTGCAYESMMASFYDILCGTITLSETMEALPPTITTSILSTTLTSSQELQPVLSFVDSMSSSEVGTEPAGNMTLSQAIEDMFLDMTLSLMASTRFRTNFSQPQNANMLTNVTISSPYIVYKYRPEILLLVYASALGISTVLVGLGATVVFGSQGSYSDYFSTIMRATRGEYVDSLVRPLDVDGKDPLPDYLANAKLKVQDPRRDGFSDDTRLHLEEYGCGILHILWISW